MVEHSAVNRVVVGSSPTRGVFFFLGSMVKRLRHRPFTAVTGVRFPYGSPISRDYSSAGRAPALQAGGHRFEPCRSHLTNSFISYADVAQLAEQLICNQQVIGSSPIIGFIQFNIELYYGQIPEWPKGTDCKSAATCFDGSNPSLPITLYRVT